MRILIIEDDIELASGLANALAQSHFVADHVNCGEAALSACKSNSYDLVILDLGLPDLDGMDLLRQLRQRKLEFPILILTARDALQERVDGLNAGADDYLTKPFALSELEARMNALLRRGKMLDEALSFGSVTLDTKSRFAAVNGKELALTAKELAVLEKLLARTGRIVSKGQLIESMYRWDEEVNPAAIEVFVSRLRKKLHEADSGVGIRSVRGLGYRLEKTSVA